MTLCVVCILAADATVGLEDDEWHLGVGVGANTAVYLSTFGDDYDVDNLQTELTTVKNSVDAQNNDGQLRMRYV